MHKNPRIIEGNPADTKFWGIKMNPRIVKTANSKPANSEGRLYSSVDIANTKALSSDRLVPVDSFNAS